LIFCTSGSLAVKDIMDVLPGVSEDRLDLMVSDLNTVYKESGRSFRIDKASNGYMFVTREEYAPYIKSLLPRTRLSPASMEVLALVAYKGPCTKHSIENIRGVDSTSSLKHLLRLKLIDIKPGKPMNYITTKRFLEMFGLDSLSDLPDISQFEEIFAEDDLAAQEDNND